MSPKIVLVITLLLFLLYTIYSRIEVRNNTIRRLEFQEKFKTSNETWNCENRKQFSEKRTRCFDKKEIRSCLKNTTILGIGDSVGGVLTEIISKNANLNIINTTHWNHEDFLPAAYTSLHDNKYSASYDISNVSTSNNPRLSYIWSPTVSKKWEIGEFRENNKSTWSYNGTRSLIENADVVFLSIAVWEMALFYRTAEEMVVIWRSRLQELKHRIKPSSRIIILGLHWLNVDIEETNSFGDRCFSTKKASVFRSALETLACCENIELLPLKHITKSFLNNYIDAVHISPFLNLLVSDMLLSAACDNVLFHPLNKTCTPLTVTRLYSEWASVPEAQIGCRPAPKNYGIIVVIVLVVFILMKIHR